MKIRFKIIVFASLFFACKYESENMAIHSSSDFVNSYEKITYCESVANINEGEYFITDGDSFLLSRLLTKGTSLSAKQSKRLVGFMQNPGNFEAHGSNCGTYFDLSCFIFSRSDTVLGVVALGCSFGDVRIIPSDNDVVGLTNQGEKEIELILSELKKQ